MPAVPVFRVTCNDAQVFSIISVQSTYTFIFKHLTIAAKGASRKPYNTYYPLLTCQWSEGESSPSGAQHNGPLPLTNACCYCSCTVSCFTIGVEFFCWCCYLCALIHCLKHEAVFRVLVVQAYVFQRWTDRGPIPVGVRNFYLLPNVHTGSESQPASDLMGARAQLWG